MSSVGFVMMHIENGLVDERHERNAAIENSAHVWRKLKK